MQHYKTYGHHHVELVDSAEVLKEEVVVSEYLQRSILVEYD